MKLSSIFLAITVFLSINTYSISAETTSNYDLSTPDATVQSFYAAATNGDLIALENMLSPRIKKLLTGGSFTIKQYAEAWSSYPVLKINKAEYVNFENDPRELASVNIIILAEGKEHKAHISLIKMNGEWLWNEK